MIASVLLFSYIRRSTLSFSNCSSCSAIWLNSRATASSSASGCCPSRTWVPRWLSPRSRSASSVSGRAMVHPSAHESAAPVTSRTQEAGGEFIGEAPAESRRAAVRAQHRGAVDRDQIVESRVQLVELAIVARCWRRGGDFVEQPPPALLDIVRQLGLAELGEVVVLDVHPVHEIGAGVGDRVAARPSRSASCRSRSAACMCCAASMLT